MCFSQISLTKAGDNQIGALWRDAPENPNRGKGSKSSKKLTGAPQEKDTSSKRSSKKQKVQPSSSDAEPTEDTGSDD